MADSRTYQLGSLTAAQVGHRVEEFLRGQGLVVEGYDGPGGYLVQARRDDVGWHKYAKFAGLDKSIQVRLLPTGGGLLQVSVGQGKWLDKVAAGAVGVAVFLPLALVPGIGAVYQLKLVGDLFSEIETFLIRGQA